MLKSLAWMCAVAGQSKISPDCFERGKASTLLANFCASTSGDFLYTIAFRISGLGRSATESSYVVPRTKFFISKNGKRGKLPRVLFLIEKVESSATSLSVGEGRGSCVPSFYQA